ncbi:MAG TPA: mannitol-1-phosphate 5-dehydrogenase [Candidatus Hydrogenedentes bacterium]|nr:mannitol-1-phosphate 5-dehydrogenase [Candidatus Hydrogenedentota bacterium]
MTKRAVHFGAGNIGRGFLGQLYYESGYQTTFVDVVDEVVQAIRARHSYPIRIVEEECQTILVEGVDAVHGKDRDAVVKALAETDIASTAVGVNALGYIAPALAAGIEGRFHRPDAPPLNIILCENLIDAGSFMREKVRAHLPPAYHAVLDERVGFVEASIGRMVPVMTEEQKAEDVLLVCVEPYCDLPVDANGFKGNIPEILHMKALANFGAYVERKLFVHNLSHAATAYLGFLRGHEYIWQAIRDDTIRTVVYTAASESCEGLYRKHGLNLEELQAHRDDLIRRYHNRALGDQIARVARDPLRKLGKKDRLIGSGLMCLNQDVAPEGIGVAVAAAFRYDQGDDPAAQTLQRIRQEQGTPGVLREVCQLGPDSPLVTYIEKGAEHLQRQGWIT